MPNIETRAIGSRIKGEKAVKIKTKESERARGVLYTGNIKGRRAIEMSFQMADGIQVRKRYKLN